MKFYQKVKYDSVKIIRFILQQDLNFCLLFMFSFVWIRYFATQIKLAMIYSTLLSAVILIAINLLKSKKNKKNGLLEKDREEAENMFLTLALKHDSVQKIYELVKKRHPNATKNKNFIEIEYGLEKEKSVVAFSSDMNGLTIQDFCNMYRQFENAHPTQIIVICRCAENQNVLKFLSNFSEKISIIDQYQLYKLFKEENLLPKIEKNYKKTKNPTYKDFIAYSFNKKRTKGYILSAFALIFCSLFVKATLYYCIISSLLIMFAVISQLNPFFNTKKNENVI